MSPDDVLASLAEGELTVEGRIPGASNATLRCLLDTGRTSLACVYKPVSGERPLWDFPTWTLSQREIAAYALSEALGWGMVPPTVWRGDGPAGPGMCQIWIDVDPGVEYVDLVRPGRAPQGWRAALDATDGAGRDVQLVHADSPQLRRIALFDVVANNADRKAGHLLPDADGRVWAIDHGVTFSADPKLRTVMWGFAGEAICDDDLRDLCALADALAAEYAPVDRWLDADERRRLRSRLGTLIRDGRYPVPGGAWPSIPWPVF